MTRRIALILTVLTGFSGLVYQVAWQKYLAALLGSHSEATAAVLGIFLGGLSYGYSLFGRVSHGLTEKAEQEGRPPHLLFTYGCIEAAIGVWALLFPFLFKGVFALALWLPHSSPGISFSIDVLLTILLIGPPTVLMGGTIPLLTQGLAHSLDDATRTHAYIYAFNTAGAFLGALAAGFFLVPWLGLKVSVMSMAWINLAAGLIFIALAKRPDKWVQTAKSQNVAASPIKYFSNYALVALLAGFAMMTLQTAMNRVGALTLGASHFTFSMVVATFVLCIALGSFAVSALPKIRPGYLVFSQWLLVAYLIVLYTGVDEIPYWGYRLRLSFPNHPSFFLPYYISLMACLFGVLLIPLGLSGATLPLLFHHLRHEVGDLGELAGKIYTWNTVGSLLGALIGGYALFFWMDLHQIFRLAIAALTVGAAVLTIRIFPSVKMLGLAGGACVLLLLSALPAWVPFQLHLGLFRESTVYKHAYDGPRLFYDQVRGSQLIFSTDDPTASVAVRASSLSARAIFVNGKSDSAIPGDNRTTHMLVLLPALFADEPKAGFIIGYGTGMSVGALASLPGMDRVVVAEMSPGVMEAASYFDSLNGDVSHNPKVEVLRSDAYRALLRSSETFDVIVSEPPNPWVTGVEMLYSQEFLSAARSRLSEQGVYAQWMHVYETDDETLELVMRTYLEVFERVSVWFVDINDFAILGFNDPADQVDWERVQAQYEEPAMRAAFAKIGIRSLPTLLAHERVPTFTLQHANLSGPIHSIEHPRVSDLAARAFYTRGRGKFPFPLSREAIQAGQKNSSLKNYLAWRQAELSEEEWSSMTSEICQSTPNRCAGVFTRWQKTHPNSRALQDKLRLMEENTGKGGSPRQMIEIILALHEPDKIKGTPLPYENVRAIQALYTRHFDYSYPFDPTILENAWLACTGDERCAEGLEAVQRTGGTSEPSKSN